MSRILSAFLILTVLALGIPAASVEAQIPTPQPCPYLFPPDPAAPPALFVDPDGTGSNYCVWASDTWDGKKMVIFAHGYVDPLRPAGTIPTDQLILTDPSTGNTVSLPEIILGMGYAFGVPSYSKNGLAVKEGVNDVEALAAMFKGLGVEQIFLVGASEGGLVTALAIEQNPMVPTPSTALAKTFTAGVSTCGPVGDFRQQVNYWGDFRVAYDYYFPNNQLGPALPTNPISVDPATIAGWGFFPSLPGPILQDVAAAISARPDVTLKLLATGKAPYDLANPTLTIPETVLGILDYSVKATDDARAELSGNPLAFLTPNEGNPYGNAGRWIGTWKDGALNQWIFAGNDRFGPDPAALAQIKQFYQTSGKIKAPLVTLHTTGDPIVPYWHEPIYMLKVWLTGNGLKLFSIPINRYGHCAFTPTEAIFAFALAVFRATGTIPDLPVISVASNQTVLSRQDFDAMLNMVNDNPPTFIFIPTIKK